MAAARSPHTPVSFIPTQSKKGGMFSSSNSSRSLSLSNTPQGIGYSPGPSNIPTSPAGSGIPAFRSLRSLLPFGPSKNATPNSPLTGASPNTSKSPFSGFGSSRRSKDRDRKTSLSNDVFRPVIAIEKTTAEESAMRRSASLSEFEKPLLDPTPDGVRWDGDGTKSSVFALRTPSPGPPLSLELSTIMEADSSGVSKNLLLGNSPSQLLSPPPPPNFQDVLPQPLRRRRPSLSSNRPILNQPSDLDADNSTLDLSTSHVADQVRNAILESGLSPNSVKQWRDADKAVVVIDADDENALADTSFNLDTADPDLVALLSPNTLTKDNSSQSVTNKAQITPSMIPSPTAPVSSTSSNTTTRLPRTRQLPTFLLRPSASPPPSPAARNFVVATPSSTSVTASLKASPAKGKTPMIAVNGNGYIPTSPPKSSGLASTLVGPPHKNPSPSHPGRAFTPNHSLSYSSNINSGDEMASNTPRAPARSLRQVVLGITGARPSKPSAPSPPSPTPRATLGRASLDIRRSPVSANDIGLGRPSLEIRRGNSFDIRRHPTPSPISTISPERPEPTTAVTTPDVSPSPEIQSGELPCRPSIESSSTTRPSLENSTISRPGSSSARLLERERERQRTPSSKMFEVADERAGVPPVTRGGSRSRKRSMSVQERLGKGGKFPSVSNAEVPRPGSSLSVGRTSRGGGAGEFGENLGLGSSGGPKPEWLGPRTVKAFRAAGLLDPDRERGLKERTPPMNDSLERLRERSGSVSGSSPSPLSGGSLSTLNRFAPLRSASEYNPGNRAHSRLAYSEAGGISSRRDSESLSAHGGGNAYGLMESPTFTGSSGSRGERDTPRSTTSTAPTSLSESFGYFGRERDIRDRDRERDRERDDKQELKEKHSTEVAALLGALSDSQRTVRMLRDENSELRERLDRFAGIVQENAGLSQACLRFEQELTGLRRECNDLRREAFSLKSTSVRVPAPPGIATSWSGSSTNSSRTVVPRLTANSPLATDVTPQYEEEYNNTVIIHDIDEGNQAFVPDDKEVNILDACFPSSTSTPSINRRLSNTSSIFPAPPPNMTLLHDEIPLGNSNRSSAEHSHCCYPTSPSPTPLSTPKANLHSRSSSSSTPPVTFKTFAGAGHQANKSSASAMSISPTTAEFSMVTGSPGSLFLRPEHELLLGDMESLDLGGAVPPIDLNVGQREDEW